MKLQYSTMERMTGAFILLTLLIFLFTVAVVGRGKNWFRKHVVFYTTFNEGYNLVSGSRVKLLGTDIGSVVEVGLSESNQARVKIRVLADYAPRIRANSVATVESPTVIGSEYININPGTTNAPPIPPEGEIPTKEKKKLMEYLEEYEVGAKLENIGKILQDLAQITGQLKDPKGPLLGTLGSLNHISKTVDAGEGSLGRLVKSDELHRQIQDELNAIARLVATLQETAGHLARAGSHIEEGSKNMEKSTREAPEMVDKVQELLDRLLKVSAIMEKAMVEVPEISTQAREGMREVNLILQSVKENFLIRPNLPPTPESESHGVEIRGD
ncbi:MAG: MlaD family protein [Deltaproteobacteria bacterium]|jgi:phospholipid/cholesterol/gamma-HCH transport system substrate-binding protein